MPARTVVFTALGTNKEKTLYDIFCMGPAFPCTPMAQSIIHSPDPFLSNPFCRPLTSSFSPRTPTHSPPAKFDGEEHRALTSGEYVQMSGRAGRRMVDKNGVVIALMTEPMEVAQAEAMVSGEGATLQSAFQLSYSMLLNMTKLEGLETEYILARCVRVRVLVCVCVCVYVCVSMFVAMSPFLITPCRDRHSCQVCVYVWVCVLVCVLVCVCVCSCSPLLPRQVVPPVPEGPWPAPIPHGAPLSLVMCVCVCVLMCMCLCVCVYVCVCVFHLG
jgi:hypothetical protein